MMRRLVWMVGALSLVAALGFGGAWMYGRTAVPALAQTPQPGTTYDSAHVITVMGQGTVRLQPNIAQINIGVETMSSTVNEAVQENETKMKALLAALTAQGIADKDIQTSNYSITLDQNVQPVPQAGTAEPSKPQYRVSNMVNVTVRDLNKVGDVLDAVIAAGANNIWGVNFGLDDPQTLQAQGDARTKAMADAKSRAQALADLGSVKMGPILSISETQTGSIIAMPAAVERAASGGPSISPGEVEVSYQVQVSYYIVP